MPLFQSTTKTRLCLDKVPGTSRMYQCEPAGTKKAGGLAGDTVEIDEAHLKLPGIAAAIEQKVLVPYAGPTQAEVKGAAKAAAGEDDEAAKKAKAEAEAKAKAEAEAKAKAEADAAAAKAKAEAEAKAKAEADAKKDDGKKK